MADEIMDYRHIFSWGWAYFGQCPKGALMEVVGKCQS